MYQSSKPWDFGFTHTLENFWNLFSLELIGLQKLTRIKKIEETLFTCILKRCFKIQMKKIPNTTYRSRNIAGHLHPSEVFCLPLVVSRAWSLPPRICHHDCRHLHPGNEEMWWFYRKLFKKQCFPCEHLGRTWLSTLMMCETLWKSVASFDDCCSPLDISFLDWV